MAEPRKTTQEDLEKELAQLKKDVASLTDTLKGYARTEAHEAKTRLDDRVDEVRRSATDAAARIEPMLKDNAVTAVAAAFGFGFVIGALLRR